MGKVTPTAHPHTGQGLGMALGAYISWAERVQGFNDCSLPQEPGPPRPFEYHSSPKQQGQTTWPSLFIASSRKQAGEPTKGMNTGSQAPPTYPGSWGRQEGPESAAPEGKGELVPPSTSQPQVILGPGRNCCILGISWVGWPLPPPTTF